MDGQQHALHPTKEAKKQARQHQKQESKLQSKKKSAQTPMHTCLLNQLIIHSIIFGVVVFLTPRLSLPTIPGGINNYSPVAFSPPIILVGFPPLVYTA